MTRLLACLIFASLLGGTAALGAPADVPCWVADDDAPEDVMSPVLRAIDQCDHELGISDAQADRLEALATAFIRETLERRTMVLAAQLALVELLRPDPRDPAAPADTRAAEAKIREVAALNAAQDVALLHVIEARKAVLTAEQRRRLATLLAEPSAAATVPPRTL